MKLFYMMVSTLFLVSCGDGLRLNNELLVDPPDNSSDCPSDFCRVFVTQNTTNGLIGGISGADTLCQTDPNYPGTGVFKAMIVDGTNRRACSSEGCGTSGPAENIDWVLYPSTEYRRMDQLTIIGTTNAAGVFSPPLENSFDSNTQSVWTGLTFAWRSLGDNCDNWTSAAAAGTQGGTDRTNYEAWSRDDIPTPNCAGLHRLLCVEQ